MLVEYQGTVIRASHTQAMLAKYERAGVPGCHDGGYIFKIDDNMCVDATMSGNIARFMNHSCAPNCRQSFDSHGCIVVETARAVSKDEELTIPYVDTRLSRRERRERLRKNFAFDCACERCAAEA